jgi:hypothetical protein
MLSIINIVDPNSWVDRHPPSISKDKTWREVGRSAVSPSEVDAPHRSQKGAGADKDRAVRGVRTAGLSTARAKNVVGSQTTARPRWRTGPETVSQSAFGRRGPSDLGGRLKRKPISSSAVPFASRRLGVPSPVSRRATPRPRSRARESLRAPLRRPFRASASLRAPLRHRLQGRARWPS